MEYILIFPNTHRALECEKILTDKQIRFKILPAPSYVTRSCGICISILMNDIEVIYNLIRDNKVVIKSIYNSDKKLIYTGKIDFNM